MRLPVLPGHLKVPPPVRLKVRPPDPLRVHRLARLPGHFQARRMDLPGRRPSEECAMMPGEFEDKQRAYDSQWRAFEIIRRMRWITLILGPVPLIWDNLLWPLLQNMGVPAIITVEDLMQILVLDVLPLDRWIDQDTFEKIWPHVVNVCTVLFLVFLIWAVRMKRLTRNAAREVVKIEERYITEELP